MITINLLPKEMQEDVRKPKSQIFAMLGAAILILISAGVFVSIHFFALPARIQALAVATQERDEAKQYEERHNLITGLKGNFGRYADAVEKCKAQQISLSKRLSMLSSIVTTPGIYWLDNLQLTPIAPAATGRATADAAVAYKWEAAAFCKELILLKVYELTTLIGTHPEFGMEVERVALPVPVEAPITGNYEEKKCFRFNLKITSKFAPKKDQGQQKPPAQPQKQAG